MFDEYLWKMLDRASPHLMRRASEQEVEKVRRAAKRWFGTDIFGVVGKNDAYRQYYVLPLDPSLGLIILDYDFNSATTNEKADC